MRIRYQWSSVKIMPLLFLQLMLILLPAFPASIAAPCCSCRGRRGSNGSSELPDEQRLMNFLLHGYELSVRPVFNSSEAVTAQMGITLTQIFDMDEKNQVLVTNVWLDQQWSDEFLTWDPAEFSNQKKIRLPSSKIWKPDLVLYNNAADFTDNLMPALAMIDANGTVFWPIPVKLRSACKVDVTYFPFDEQMCDLKFGSWTYDGFQVNLHLLKEDVDTTAYVPNGEWELLGTKAIRNVLRYPCCLEPYPDITFYIFLRRRLLYYMYHVIYPCIMMSTLTLLVFCLPPDSGEKIALGITVLLAFSVLMLSIADRLPETSESVPLISIYLTVVMSMTSVSVIMTVFVLNLHHRGPSRRPLPDWLRRLLLTNRPRSAATSGHAGAHGNCGIVGGLAELGNTSAFLRNLSLKLTIDSLAHNLNMHAQAAAAAVAAEGNGASSGGGGGGGAATTDASLLDAESSGIAYMPASVRSNHVAIGSSSSGGRYQPLRPAGRSSAAASTSVGASSSSSSAAATATSANKDILEALRKIIDKHEADDTEARLIAEWRAVAQFVDKLLFWVYLLCTFASTLIILVIAPVYRIIPYTHRVPVARNDFLNSSDWERP